MRIPVAKQGYVFIIPPAILGIIALVADWCLASILLFTLSAFCLNFFRDPERQIPSDPNVVVSPADGKVVEIVTEQDPILGKTFKRISIFLNVFNVHVNRSPIAGTVGKIQYNHGKFLAAFNEKASLDNEQNILLIQKDGVDILVKQIAGLIARRIVCWVKESQEVGLGERFGLIRFGSRVDIFIPESTEVSVAIGDHVKGGSSVIGYLKGN